MRLLEGRHRAVTSLICLAAFCARAQGAQQVASLSAELRSPDYQQRMLGARKVGKLTPTNPTGCNLLLTELVSRLEDPSENVVRETLHSLPTLKLAGAISPIADVIRQKRNRTRARLASSRWSLS